jgi:hypothetical protein
MKRMRLFYLLIVSAIVLWGCTKPNNNTTTSKSTVAVSIKPVDTTAIYNDSISFTVVTSSSNALSTAKFTQSLNGGVATQVGKVIALTNLTERVKMEYHVPAGTPGKIKLTCTVTDAAGNSDTASAMITVLPDYYSYSTVLLANYNDISGKGSFFSAQNGLVYSNSTAAANQKLIDMIFIYNTTNQYTLAAPADTIFGTGATKISADNVQNWTFKNNTNFYTTSLTSFSSIHTAADIANALNGGSTFTIPTRANSLTVGQIVVFFTEQGKYGLAQIAQATGGDASGNGALTINVLYQK